MGTGRLIGRSFWEFVCNDWWGSRFADVGSDGERRSTALPDSLCVLHRGGPLAHSECLLL